MKMKEYIIYIKKYAVWMLISYIVVILVFYTFFLLPQRRFINEVKAEKETVEYYYLKIKNIPVVFDTINKTLSVVKGEIKYFEWLANTDDPNFLMFQYLGEKAEKYNLELSILERNLKDEKSSKYYIWKTKLVGSFPDLLKFLYEVETGDKYLKIDEIEVGKEGEKVFFDLKIVGIKGGKNE